MTNELWCSFVSAECSLPFMLVHLVNIVPRMTSQFVWQFTLCCLPTQSENFRKRLQLKLHSTHSLHKVMKTAIDWVTIQRRGDFTKIPENWSLVLMFGHFISYQIQSAFCCICLHSIQSTLAFFSRQMALQPRNYAFLSALTHCAFQFIAWSHSLRLIQ